MSRRDGQAGGHARRRDDFKATHDIVLPICPWHATHAPVRSTDQQCHPKLKRRLTLLFHHDYYRLPQINPRSTALTFVNK
jgi:hypothetical protein